MSKKKIFHISLGSCFLFFSQMAVAQNPSFVQDDIIKVIGITNTTQTYNLNTSQKQTKRTYYDGMGRPIQIISVQASPAGNDLIQPIAYDSQGRQSVSYLPYAGTNTDAMGSYRPNALSTDLANFYSQTGQYLIATDGAPFSQKIFENSPLQRLLSMGMVGSGYQPGVLNNHLKTIKYRSNTGIDGNIMIWNPDDSFTAGNFYLTNSLSVKDSTDESNNETLSFIDNSGNMVLKRQILGGTNLDTYYIYNSAGLLSCIIPPKALTLMTANGNYNISQTGVNKLVFIFSYDNHGRLIEKTVPAKGTMYIVYDPMNRPVLLQDANMAASNQWNYIRYDAKGRLISQGIYMDSAPARIGRVNMQAYVNSLGANYAATWCESRSSTLTNGGYYTNAVFPTGSTGTLTPLTYAYYDDYDMNNDGLADFNYKPQGLTNEETQTSAPLKGVPTIISETTVGSNIGANTWLTTVIFYDKRGNAIQTLKNNHIYYSGPTTLTDVNTIVPDFAGVSQTALISKQTASATTVKVQTNISYDQMYRVTSISQSYNGGTITPVASYTYNELGQVIKKGLGYVNVTTWLQNLDMRYNIRGQLTSINNSKLNSDNGVTNSDATNDVFGMQMLYDVQDTNLGNLPSYNGNLSGVKWMSKDGSGNNSYERAYIYKYDNMDRDTSAIYAERATAATGAFSITHGWDENRITYDPNGNIMTMFRMVSTQGAGTHTPIDNLTYTYSTSNPNQLLSVADATGDSRGFIAGAGNYTYDANGNLTADPYKGITQITYNVLNRTNQIIFPPFTNRFIIYTYNASGQLIRKLQYDNSSGQAALQNQTDYVDGFVFTSTGSYGTPVLSYFPMPEGRVLYNNGAYTQEFIIADPQGNARVSFQNNGSGAAVVKQENSYYAFGMIMPGSAVALPTTPNKQLYNGGSEWQNDYSNLPDYYETFNRNYDAALGRWIGVDPIPESAESMTGYQYAGNNPVNMFDPDGSTDIYSPDGHLIKHYDDGSDANFEDVGPGDLRMINGTTIDDIDANTNQSIYDYWHQNPEQLGEVTVSSGSSGGNGGGSTAQSGFIGGGFWNGTSNTLTAIGFGGGAASYKLGLDLKRQYDIASAVYEGFHSPQPSILLKTAIGSIGVDAQLVKGLSNTLDVGGKVLGGIGVGITAAEIISGHKKLIGEGGLDLVMGGIGFVPGWGWAVSGLYFGGKYVLQETGHDFWNH